MFSSLLLIALCATPSALQQQTKTVEQRIEELAEWLDEWRTYSSDAQVSISGGQVDITGNQVELNTALDNVVAEAADVKAQLETLRADVTLQSTEIRELLAIVGATQNATSQLLTELDTLRGRQAASAAVQASQVLMLVVYFLTIISIYVVKRCRKVREKSQRKEFELLEKQLRSSKAKRRAAAAKEKSAPAPSQE